MIKTKYFVKRVVAKIIFGAKLYMVIVLEFAVGIGILCCSLNMLYTSQENLDKTKQKFSNQKINVSIKNFAGMDYSDELPGNLKITLEDYDYIAEKYGKTLNSSYVVMAMSQSLVLDTQKFYTFCYVFMSDEDFAKISLQRREQNVAYVGANVMKSAKNVSAAYQNNNKNVVSFSKSIIIDADKITIGNKPVSIRALKPLNSVMSANIEDCFGNIYPINDCAIFPLKMLPNVQTAIQEYDDPMMPTYLCPILTLEYKSSNFEGNVIPEILEFLSMQHPKYKYEVEDKYLAMEATERDSSAQIYRQAAVAVATLLVVIITAVGILMIMIEKRKKAMAITLAYGATLTRVAAELLCEILVVFELGALLGIVGAWLVNPVLLNINGEIIFHFNLIYSMPIVAAVAAIISALPAIISLRFTAISSSLRGE